MIFGNLQGAVYVSAKTTSSNATNATFGATFNSIVNTNAAAFVQVRYQMEPASATNVSAVPAILRLEHGDGTTFVTVAGCEGTTGTPSTNQFSLPVHNNTTNPYTVMFYVKPLAQGNIYRLVCQPSSSTNDRTSRVDAFVYPVISPETSSEHNVAAFVVAPFA